MRRHLVSIVTLAVLLLAARSLPAQPLRMGNLLFAPSSSDLNGGPVRTDIDLNTPATATGSITSVTYSWSLAGCTNAFKIKFFRRSGDTLTMTAERGPFSSAPDNQVTLSPAVDVQQGDLIGIARVGACGNVNVGPFFGSPSEGYVQYASDVTGSVSLAAGTHDGVVLGVEGTGTATEGVSHVIAVAGSTAGALGSNFKTAVQLFNGDVVTTTGRLVFHRAGATATTSDPSFPYTLGAGQVLNISDVVAAVGQSGLGTIDLVVAAGQTPPIAVVRVFNDAGAAGTSGLSEEPILPYGQDSRVIPAFATGFLLTPSDLSKARFNIGVRSLFTGATLTATLRDSAGATIATVTKSYPPTWFEQVDAETFFNGTPVGPNQSISVSINSGTAIIYGSTTDNTTNDPAIQFVRIASVVIQN